MLLDLFQFLYSNLFPQNLIIKLMKFYKHKQTGKIIGVIGSLIDMVDDNGNITMITQQNNGKNF